jgi:hypothetical protein
MQEDPVREFVQAWFDDLSRHAPVDRMLPRLSADSLEMHFPERALYGHADFEDWYAVVGEAFADQGHTLEALSTETRGDLVDLVLTVVWSATQTSDNTRSAFRVNQNWRLRKGPGDQLRIVTYRVGELTPISLAEAAGARADAR